MTGVPVERTYDWHRAVVGEVSTEALALVLVLSNRMNADGTLPKQFTPSLETMSQEMGYAPNSRRGIVRAMRELEAKGFLLVERGGGRKTTNTYRATAPITVAVKPQEAPETVALEAHNGGRSATHPTLTYSNPNPPTGVMGDVEGRRRRAELANQVIRAVTARLPDAEADALVRDLLELKNGDKLRDELAGLVEAGHHAAVVYELSAVKVPGSSSPYAGCAHPGRVAWSRVRELRQRLGVGPA